MVKELAGMANATGFWANRMGQVGPFSPSDSSL